MANKLLAGTIVHWVAGDGNCRAAFITYLYSDQPGVVNLNVQADGVHEGTDSSKAVTFSEKEVSRGEGIYRWHSLEECPQHNDRSLIP